jgi:crossover junction endodeoxyribonuclease RusA
MLPFEFVVIGDPVSYQSHNRERLKQWQESVRQAAELAWSSNPLIESPCLLLVVYYFGPRPVLLDNDNLIKPIQDALNGLVYRDDKQITDTIIRRTSVAQTFVISNNSDILLEAIRRSEGFLYVRVEDAPDHRALL